MNLRLSAKGVLRRRYFLLTIGIGQAMLCGAVPPDAPAPDHGAKDAPVNSGNPYAVIVERNIFHLNPVPVSHDAEDKLKAELPVVKITGFLDVGGRKRVLFVADEKGKKDHSYYSLSEGEKSADTKLELVKIHPGEDAVDVVNDGLAVTLTLEKDSAQASKNPAAAPPNNQPPGPPSPDNGISGHRLFQQRPDPNVPGFSPGRLRIPPQ
jgi:hypothetical protein